MMAKNGAKPENAEIGAEWYPALRLYAARLLKNPADAEDLVQEAFLKLAEQEKRGAVQMHRAWLYRTVRNLAFDLLRRRKTFQQIQDFLIYKKTTSDSTPSPSENLEKTETVEMLLLKLNELSPRHREAVRLKFQEKLTYDEIAAVMGESRSTIGWLLHEAIITLRQMMTENGAENLAKGVK